MSFLISVLILVGLIWVVFERLATGRWPDWTGFGGYISPRVPQDKTFERGKTLWDWMELLIIPAILAGGAYWLTESARQSDQVIADDNTREAALQTYIDRMAELLIQENLSESNNVSKVRAVARARTLTVLRGLDANRKGALIKFLYEADLIQKDKVVIDLSGAELSHADLSYADLSNADLSNADLSDANLSNADLSYANLNGLNGADLSNADLSYANLWHADLSNADLSYADLNGADLSVADLSVADLTNADLSETKYTKNTKDIKDTIWPEGFDPDAAGAIRVTE